MANKNFGKVIIKTDDIVGLRVGKLEVVEYAGHHYDITLGGRRMRHKYTCKCDCGTIKQIHRGQLLNKIVHSCGCARSKRKDNDGGMVNGNDAS